MTCGFLESSRDRLQLRELSFQFVRGHIESLSQPFQVPLQVLAVQLTRLFSIWQVKQFEGGKQMPAWKLMGDHFFCQGCPLLKAKAKTAQAEKKGRIGNKSSLIDKEVPGPA